MTIRNLQGPRVHERSLELAAAAVDYDLNPVERAELDAHLAGCPTCARRAAAMRSDAARLGRPLALLPSSRVDDAIYAAIARQHQRPARLTLLVAAGLLLIALLGAIAVGTLLRTWQPLPISVAPLPSTTPAADVSPRPDASPTIDVSPRPDASPVVVGETWTTIASAPSDVDNPWMGFMQAVTLTETGLVAVGGAECVPQNTPTSCQGSTWTAAPGQGWIAAPDQPGLDLGLDAPNNRPPTGVIDVAAGPSGFVAIGYPYDGRGPGIWRSPNGRTWERAQVDFGSSPVETSSYRIAAVAGSPRGYVIVGYVIDYTGPGGNARTATYPARAAAWASPDGVTWTRATDSVDLDIGLCVDTGEEPGCGGMRAVAASPAGFVAVGHRRAATGPGARPSAWTSADGLTWIRADAGLGRTGSLSAVAVGAPGVVATGPGVDALSTDGLTWTTRPIASPQDEESRLASDGGVVLGFGWNHSDATFHVWRTTDGLTREAIEAISIPADVQLITAADIAVLGDRAVIVIWVERQTPNDSGLPGLPPLNVSFQTP